MRRLFAASALGAALTLATTVFAQSPQPLPQPTSSDDESRPATATASGTTGIWFVPTAEVLGHKKWAVSLYRTNMDDGQGFSDSSTFPATFSVGVGGRAEVFGSWALITRLDRDTRPLFFTSSAAADAAGTGGGILVDFPRFRSEWTGNKRGDFTVGGKFNLMGGSTSPLGAAVRAMVKLPVGDDENGTSSGATDFQLDGIVSSYHPIAEVSGYAGAIFRGNPDGYQLTNGLRWGLGVASPQRYNLGFRLTAELFGERYFDDVITAPTGLTGTDGSVVPISTRIKNPIVGALGVTWQAPNGFFIGGAASWNLGMKNRDSAGFPDTPKDDKGLQVRLGFHPGARNRRAANSVRVTPVAPTIAGGPVGSTGPGGPAGPVVAAVQNRPPTVRASCDPCTVEVGRTALVSADGQDPDGDALTYQWTVATGTLTSPTSRQSPWTAPMQVGPVPFTVTVNDGKGGTASDRVTIQVTRPAPRQYSFEDVHFDFDRFTLRTDALRVLDDAVAAMQADPTLRLEVEGHTCSVGTPEYNLALGERRAVAVRTYLMSRGIAGDRVRTVTYGEERPKYDNSREDTRRLNRRASLVVRLQ